MLVVALLACSFKKRCCSFYLSRLVPIQFPAAPTWNSKAACRYIHTHTHFPCFWTSSPFIVLHDLVLFQIFSNILALWLLEGGIIQWKAYLFSSITQTVHSQIHIVILWIFRWPLRQKMIFAFVVGAFISLVMFSYLFSFIY